MLIKSDIKARTWKHSLNLFHSIAYIDKTRFVFKSEAATRVVL